MEWIYCDKCGNKLPMECFTYRKDGKNYCDFCNESHKEEKNIWKRLKKFIKNLYQIES